MRLTTARSVSTRPAGATTSQLISLTRISQGFQFSLDIKVPEENHLVLWNITLDNLPFKYILEILILIQKEDPRYP